MVLEVVKVEPTLFELADRLLNLALRVDIPVEVELPSRYGSGHAAAFVGKRDAELDDLELVDAGLDAVVLTLLFWPTFKITFECARELSVHCNQGVPIQQGTNFGELDFEVVHPHVHNFRTFTVVFLQKRQLLTVNRVEEKVFRELCLWTGSSARVFWYLPLHVAEVYINLDRFKGAHIVVLELEIGFYVADSARGQRPLRDFRLLREKRVVCSHGRPQIVLVVGALMLVRHRET